MSLSNGQSNESGSAEDDDVEGNVLTPAGVTFQSVNFIFRFFKAEDVPQMDTAAFQGMKKLIGFGNDSPDAEEKLVDTFAEIKFIGKRRKTKVIEENNNPEWNEELCLPLKFPSMCNLIKIRLYDWDRVGTNDAIGSFSLPISEISSNDEDAGFLPTFGPTFINLYGSPREFSNLNDQLDDMNYGKCGGCAFRGRLMVELKTKLQDDTEEKTPKSQPIEDDIIAATTKYMRRRKYRLVVAFYGASMIEKADNAVEFEVSIGNYGNKFDVDTPLDSSTTEPTKPVFGGTHYSYVSWGARKPVICLTSYWEEVDFRYHSLNVLLRMVSSLETDIDRVEKMIDDKEFGEMETASEIVGILDDLIGACRKGIPDPRGRNVANALDQRVFQRRKLQLELIKIEATELRRTCTDVRLALTSLQDYLERLKELAHEPQNSMPDVVIWMISNNQRVAYARIPANEVLYSKNRDQYSGIMCGRTQTIFLKYPTTSSKSKKNYKIACQLQAMIWLGRAADQEDFNFDSRGQISVYADMYEIQQKIPIRGWISDGYKDRSMKISLSKDKFLCPSGWQWAGDWFVNPKSVASNNSLIREVFTEEAYENQNRFAGELWEEQGYKNSENQAISSLDAIGLPEGWVWETKWNVDHERPCDEDGWEYTKDANKKNPIWEQTEKVFHQNRKRRWVRTKKCVDAKIQAKKEREKYSAEEGWEYAKTSGSDFRHQQRTMDLIRRRKWLRRLKTEDSSRSAIIFNLSDQSFVITDEGLGEETEPSEDELSSVRTGPKDEHKEEDKEKSPSFFKKLKSLGRSSDDSDDEESEHEEKKGEKSPSFFQKLKKIGKDGDSDKKAKVRRSMPSPKMYLDFQGAIPIQLRVYLYQARDLLSMDQDSLSDPFIFVSFMDRCERTRVIENSLNPVWNQTLIIDLNYYGDLNHLRSSCPDIIVEVFDKDDIGSLEFMGSAAFQPQFKIDPEDSTMPKLAWYDIHKGNADAGNLLACAELLVKYPGRILPLPPPRQMNIYRIPIGIKPELQRTAIELMIWGVRNMKAFELLSVDKPSVVVEIGDVKIQTEVIKNLKKTPTFKEPILFVEANLPKKQIYCPPILFRVKDNRKFGRRPTVGRHVISDITENIVPTPEIEVIEEDEGFDGDTSIEISPPSPTAECNVEVQTDYGVLNEAGPSGLQDETNDQENQHLIIKSPSERPERGNGSVSPNGTAQTEIEIYDPNDADEEIQEPEEEAGSDDENFGQSIISKVDIFRKKIIDTIPTVENEKELRDDEMDWWSKYYASLGDGSKCGQYLKTGMDTVQIYSNELENEEPYNQFSDFIQTFKLFCGKQGKDDDDPPPIVGELKAAVYMYPLPDDPGDPMPEKIFKNPPSTDTVEVKVRVYVVRAFDLSPQDYNGLADPYLKIKVGKKRILDRPNYIPNTLNPTFGRMFELDLILPFEKDLYVEVFDWDLIGTDDKVGETIIDLENRYLSKFKAWCGLPKSYCTTGLNQWRDQMTPKEWLIQRAKELGVDEPVWNGNTSVLFNKKKYMLDTFERKLIPCKDWGPADQRLALHVLRTMPHVTEHVETRPLFSDTMPGIEQGRLQLWVDMFPKDYGEPENPFDITPRKATEYYVRVIIWNCSEIPMMDTSVFGEKMTDIYVKAWIGGMEHKMQKTDIHYRSLDGTGMFNWRMIFPIDYLLQERAAVISKKEGFFSLDKTTTKVAPTLYLQVWDNDLFGPNEYISEITLPLNKTPKCTRFSKFATIKNIPDLQGNCSVALVDMFDQKMLKGWWPLYAMKEGGRVQAGKIEMSIEVLTREEHDERPAAKARDEPNANPKLDPPKRPATSFAWWSSPWKSFRYIIWKRYGCIIITILLVVLLILFLALFIYTFPGSFTSWFLGKF
ncbi:myoferlin-like isoform X2 [Styela clava]